MRILQTLRRIEVLLRRALRGKIESGHDMWHLLKQAHRLRCGLHGFCQTLQTYVMFNVIEGGWQTFATAIGQVRLTILVTAQHLICALTRAWLEHARLRLAVTQTRTQYGCFVSCQ